MLHPIYHVYIFLISASGFLHLQGIYEILSDDAKRADYDRLYRAKKAEELRRKEMDSKRLKLKRGMPAG